MTWSAVYHCCSSFPAIVHPPGAHQKQVVHWFGSSRSPSNVSRKSTSHRSFGAWGPSGEDAEQEAEDFAALLLYRLGRLPSDRASIVQVRLGEAFG